MATFNSEKRHIAYPAEKVFTKLSNLENLNTLLDRLPADAVADDQRAMLENVKITADTISMPAGPVGDITLKITETREPSFIKLEGVGTPVEMALMLNIIPAGADTCDVETVIDIAIPAMLKPMVAGPLQKMVDQFAMVLTSIPFGE